MIVYKVLFGYNRNEVYECLLVLYKLENKQKENII